MVGHHPVKKANDMNINKKFRLLNYLSLFQVVNEGKQ